MRTVLFLVAAFLLLAAVLLLAKLFSPNYPEAMRWATIAYVILWFGIAAENMWVGVTKAGYAATEELPIFLMLFGLPAASAVVLKWRFL